MVSSSRAKRGDPDPAGSLGGWCSSDLSGLDKEIPMTETTLYTWLTYTVPTNGKVLQEIDPSGHLLVTVLAPDEPPPPQDTVTGKVIAGDIIFDTDLDAYILKDVRLEPLAASTAARP
jgi:hypothetical protein